MEKFFRDGFSLWVCREQSMTMKIENFFRGLYRNDVGLGRYKDSRSDCIIVIQQRNVLIVQIQDLKLEAKKLHKWEKFSMKNFM